MCYYDPQEYCVATDEPTTEDCSPVYINSCRIRENGGTPIASFRSQPDALTTVQVLKGTTGKYGDDDAFGEREVLSDGSFGHYKWINYNEFSRRVSAFAAGLQKLGIKYGDSVGIYSTDCTWWQITQFATHTLGAVIVPVYDSLGAGAASYIVNHAECKIVVTHIMNFESALKLLEEPNTCVKEIIVISDKPVEGHEDIKTCKQVLEMGEEIKDFVPYEVKTDDTAIIMYTSGSTGIPKGCVLTHRNLIAGGTGLANPGCSINHADTYISFLPLAHIYELCSQLCFIAQGVRIGFYTGSIKNLMSDIQELRPTMMLGVPRVFNRLAETMNKKIDELSLVPRTLIRAALKLKTKQLLEDKPHSLLLDNLLFKKFRDVLGGRVRLIVSGGAPIMPEIYDFLRCAITPNILQGYGLTEIAAAGCIQMINSKNSMAVGPTSIATDMKLRRVEGMEYDPRGNPPQGEILFRGPSIFKEYHKDPKLTQEALVDGWFATGDIGVLTSEGVIQIIDRAKQLVKLSQGEYLSITTLTEAYSAANGVSNIYIYADSCHNHPIAVVIPNKLQIEEWKEKGINNFMESDVAINEMINNLADLAKEKKLRGFEKIPAIILDDYDFTIENGLLTPSQKPQLSKLRTKYEYRLIELYNKYPELRG